MTNCARTAFQKASPLAGPPAGSDGDDGRHLRPGRMCEERGRPASREEPSEIATRHGSGTHGHGNPPVGKYTPRVGQEGQEGRVGGRVGQVAGRNGRRVDSKQTALTCPSRLSCPYLPYLMSNPVTGDSEIC